MDANHTPDPSGAARKRSQRWMGIVLVGVVLITGGSWFLMRSLVDARPVDDRSLDDFGAVPAFALPERNGRSVTAEDLKGKVWVADFILTRSGGTRLATSSQMSDLQKTLERVGDVRLISFSVDPNYGTPSRPATYAERNQASDEKWLFLTGGQEQMQKLAREGFHLPTTGGGPARERAIHSPRFVLVDTRGRIRGYYSTEEGEARQELLDDLGTLLHEQTR